MGAFLDELGRRELAKGVREINRWEAARLKEIDGVSYYHLDASEGGFHIIDTYTLESKSKFIARKVREGMSRAQAEAYAGALYPEDVVGLSNVALNRRIYGSKDDAGQSPDTVAQQLYDAGILSDYRVDAMWEKLREEIERYGRLRDNQRALVEREKYFAVREELGKRLHQRQWLQEHEGRFSIEGKAGRIEKLRESEPVVVAYNGEYALERKAAKRWALDNIRGKYVNEDTGHVIEVSQKGIKKVTSHGERDEAHLKSFIAIPEMIRRATFIENRPNEKNNDKYESYDYYVCGLQIPDASGKQIDYTAKIVVGVANNAKYYDHRLSKIEKGALISSFNNMATAVATEAPLSVIKDTKLLSILQPASSMRHQIVGLLGARNAELGVGPLSREDLEALYHLSTGTTPRYAIEGRAAVETPSMAAVRARYEGTAQWMKAPNGEPTKLFERQWLQVRTPEFKAWFGDWEKAFTANRLLSMNAFRVSIHERLDKKGIKDVFASFKETENAETHRKVLFPSSSAGKIHYHKGFDTNSMIRSFKALFESAILAISEGKDGHKDHPNFTGYEHYINKFTIDGTETFFIRFTVPIVRNNKGAEYVHSSAISRVDIYTEKEASSLDTDIKLGQLDASFTDTKIAKLFDARNNVSKVVDENGEPRVVYHGTTERFTVFDIDHARQDVDIPAFFFSSGVEDWGAFGDIKIAAFLNIRNPIEKPISKMNGSKIRDELVANGYDGTITEEDGAETEFAVFRPNQIKSATDNVGTFDGRNNDIRYAIQGDLGYIKRGNGWNYETNESLNATYAREEGRKPYHEWSREDFANAASVAGNTDLTALIAAKNKIPLSILRERYLYNRNGEWHHINGNMDSAKFYILLESAQEYERNYGIYGFNESNDIGYLLERGYKTFIALDSAEDLLAYKEWKKQLDALEKKQKDAEKAYDEFNKKVYRSADRKNALTQEIIDKDRELNSIVYIDIAEEIRAHEASRPKPPAFDYRNVTRYAITGNDIKNWNETLDAVANGTIETRQNYTVLSRTPAVLRMLDVNNLPLEITGGVLNKITEGKHNIAIDDLRNLPYELDDPVAVFQSATHGNAYTILTSLKEGNNNVIVALALDFERRDRILVNEILSAYGKATYALNRWIEDGLLLYINETKNRSLPRDVRLQLPKTRLAKNGRSLFKSEEDLASFVENTPIVSNPPVNVKPNIRYSIIGTKGIHNLSDAMRVADNLALARMMEQGVADSAFEGLPLAEAAKPKDAKTIRLATGWERGVDGLWRYEIPDGMLLLKGEDPDYARFIEQNERLKKVREHLLQEKPTVLGDIYHHPELYKAYPWLEQVSIELFEVDGVHGWWNSDTRKIGLNKWCLKNYDNALNTLVHEVQHAIQDFEGFEAGGSLTTASDIERLMRNEFSELLGYYEMLGKYELKFEGLLSDLKGFSYFDRENKAKAQDRVKTFLWRIQDTFLGADHQDEIRALGVHPFFSADPTEEASRDFHERFSDLYNRIAKESLSDEGYVVYKKRKQELDALVPFERYKRLAGEVEARNVSKRRWFSKARRRETLLAETEDVARIDQFILDAAREARYAIIGTKGAQELQGEAYRSLVNAEREYMKILSARGYNPVVLSPAENKRLRETYGWEMGTDGKWRREIGYGSITPKFAELFDRGEAEEWDAPITTTLGEIYNNTELYQAYPALRVLPVVLDEYPYGAWRAVYGRDNMDEPAKIAINACFVYKDDPKFFGTLVHEVQHAIQEIEGFAFGAVPSQAYHEMHKEGIRKFVESERAKNPENPRLAYYERLLGELDKTHIANLFAGEAEARNARRRALDPDLRDRTFEETEDTPRNLQIVRSPFDDRFKAFLPQEKATVKMLDEHYDRYLRAVLEQTTNKKQKSAEARKRGDDILAEDATRLSIQGDISAWLNKRDDLTAEDKAAFLSYVKTIPDNKEKRLTGYWFAKGTVRVPEDQQKIHDALEMCARKKVDPMQFDGPAQVFVAYGELPKKDARINPDTVPTLSNKRELAEGVTVYDVEDSEASRQNMRQIINSHWGKDANPWCLLQGDGEGNLTDKSARYWEHYDAVQKRVAFQNGKLLAFCASDEYEDLTEGLSQEEEEELYESGGDTVDVGVDQWWDRQDEPHTGIPIMLKGSGELEGFTGHAELSEEGTMTPPRKWIKGVRWGNGIYEERRADGTRVSYEEYKDGKHHGRDEVWYPDGQLQQRLYYVNGRLDGIQEEWFNNGQLRRRENYSNGRADGIQEEWYFSGHLCRRENFVNGKLHGIQEEWHENGLLRRREHYVNGRLDGIQEEWHENGQLRALLKYVDGKMHGVSEWWYENGQHRERAHFVNEYPHGIVERWMDNGLPLARIRYEHGRVVEDLLNGARFSLEGGWGDLSRKVPVVGNGTHPFAVMSPRLKDNRDAIYQQAIDNVKEQPNYIEEGGLHYLRLGDTKLQITKKGLFHSNDRRWQANADADVVIGDLLNASFEIPETLNGWHYRVGIINTGTPEFVLISSKEAGGKDEIKDVYILKAVDKKRGRSSLTSTSPDTPSSFDTSIAKIKEVWETEFLPGILKRHPELKQYRYIDKKAALQLPLQGEALSSIRTFNEKGDSRVKTPQDFEAFTGDNISNRSLNVKPDIPEYRHQIVGDVPARETAPMRDLAISALYRGQSPIYGEIASRSAAELALGIDASSYGYYVTPEQVRRAYKDFGIEAKDAGRIAGDINKRIYGKARPGKNEKAGVRPANAPHPYKAQLRNFMKHTEGFEEMFRKTYRENEKLAFAEGVASGFKAAQMLSHDAYEVQQAKKSEFDAQMGILPRVLEANLGFEIASTIVADPTDEMRMTKAQIAERNRRREEQQKKREEEASKAKAYAYDVSKIEVLAGNLVSPKSNPNTSTSISATILLNGVENSKGEFVLDNHRIATPNANISPVA